MQTPRVSTASSVRPLGVLSVLLSCLFARGAAAQESTATPAAVGVWRGTSTCLVRPSPCKDETVVYRIARIRNTDSVAFDARKFVNGQEEEMGVLNCGLTARGTQITCAIPRATWHFTVRGDNLLGELRLADNTRFRDVRTARSQ